LPLRKHTLMAQRVADVAVIAAAAAAWVFLVRWAWRQHLLERFLGTDSGR
jgi:hypothetical protein